MSTQLPPTEYLKEAFDYFPETGKFFWKKRPQSHFRNPRGLNIFNALHEGEEAGAVSVRRGGKAKYVMIGIGFPAKRFYAHRLAFAWMGVPVPEGMQVDHINRNSTDNRWENLQIVTNQENNFNAKRRGGPNSHLPRGMDQRPNGKFTVKLRHNGIWHQLGTYATTEEASAARIKKAEELGIKNFLQ